MKKYKNSEIVFDVRAGRDIGPVTRMDGSGLIITVDVFTLDLRPLPKALVFTKASAQRNLEEWNLRRSSDISISRYFDGTGLRYIFREGPLWPMDSSLNIYIQLQIDDFVCEFRQQAIQIRKNS